jgi:hypothetical protein
MARATRLVTGDTLTEPIRTWIEARASLRDNGDGTARLAPYPWRFVAGVIRCHWCASMYVAATGNLAYLTWTHAAPPWQWEMGTRFFLYPVMTLASSWLIATAADWLDSPPPVKPLHVTLHDTRTDQQ